MNTYLSILDLQYNSNILTFQEKEIENRKT